MIRRIINWLFGLRCPKCRSRKIISVPRSPFYELNRCDRCGHLWQA